MKVKYKNKSFIVHWPQHLKDQLFIIEKNYKENGRIKWKKAEADGMLKGIPKHLSLKQISSFFNSIKQQSKERKKIYYQNNRELYCNKNATKNQAKRRKLFKPIRKWSTHNNNTLKQLAQKYKKSSINWVDLAQDKLTKNFPEHDPIKIRQHYHSLLRDPKKHSQNSMKWNKTNKTKYLKIAQNHYKTKKTTINDFLFNLIPTR